MTPTRFDARVAKGPDCWVWTGALFDSGYGKIRRGGTFVGAHRIAYERWIGPIPRGMQVLHHCDNRGCVRPDHLFLGTHTDNMRDMVAKGRAGWQKASRIRVRMLSNRAPCPCGHTFGEHRLSLDGGAARAYRCRASGCLCRIWLEFDSQQPLAEAVA